MKGLKVIPLFLLLIVFTYFGMLFVEANRSEVTIQFGNYQSPPTALGFVVLTSALMGMIIAGILCGIELLALHMHNRRLMRRLSQLPPRPASDKLDAHIAPTPASNRFS